MKLLVISIFIGLRLTATIKAEVEGEEPEPPTNGLKYKINTTTIGYYCNKGFVLHGSLTSVRVNGEWSTSGRTCEKFLDVPEGWMGCGYPGRPLNGYRYIEKMEENKLKYVCNESYTLVGQQERTCQANGSWTPEIPNCVKNLAKGKPTQHNRGGFSAAYFSNDDDIETCVSQSAEFHGSVDLQQVSLFNTVQLLIYSGDKHGDVRFYVSNKSDDSNQEIHRIKSNVPKLMRFSFTPVVARYLIISFQDQTSICDIKIYNSNETGTSCGPPDVPLHGISNRNHNLATFQCESGYTMSGNPSIRCLHGFWETSLPVCVNPDKSNYEQPQISQDPETKISDSQTQDESVESQSQNTKNIILGVGVGVAALCLIIIVAFLLCKRHRSKQNEQKQALVSGKSNNTVTASKPQMSRNDETEDPSLLYESIDDPNYANFLITTNNDKTNIELRNLARKQSRNKNDSVSVENELYEGF